MPRLSIPFTFIHFNYPVAPTARDVSLPYVSQLHRATALPPPTTSSCVRNTWVNSLHPAEPASSSVPDKGRRFPVSEATMHNGTPPQNGHDPDDTPAAASKPPVRDIDVVLTHSTADFDSLAAAVGLARLRGPHTLVVTPGGENPALRRFLALHRQLFDIIDAKAIDPRRLRWVGVVDTVRRDRLGVAADWPLHAHEVEVYDHHVGRECDIQNEHDNVTLIVEPVGAVCTLICERLMREQHAIPPSEATLLALAIHSDTGSLTFEQTTPRDASALSWLMSQGALQRSIAEFTQTLLTDEQQGLLSQGLSTVRRRQVNGIEIGSLCLVGRSFLKGMSMVASDLLDIANLDVLVLAYVNCRGRKAKRKRRVMDDDEFCGPEQLKQVSLIGRARARVDGVDFNKLFADLGGGGHARAASASVKLTEADAEHLVDQLVDQVQAQIPPARPVSEFMTTLLVTVGPTTSMTNAQQLMLLHSHQTLPVVDEQKVLVGLITLQDVHLAKRKRGDHSLEMNVKSWLHNNVITVDQNTPFHVAEKTLEENSLGMLCVVDENKTLLGAITRTDVLVARRLWPDQLVPLKYGFV